jgi:hypothetical protein
MSQLLEKVLLQSINQPLDVQLLDQIAAIFLLTLVPHSIALDATYRL